MNWKEAYAYIEQIQKQGNVLGLELLYVLLEKLGNPQNKLNIVHVAGTNGKGSTIAFLEGILKCAGYRVGRYISPTVFGYLERFQVNGAWMTKTQFAELMTQIAPLADAVSERFTDGQMHIQPVMQDAVSIGKHSGLTAYEIETAAAFLYFLQQQCDIVLLETGIGGRDDATNVAKQVLCSVLTSISLDHMRILGSTPAEIAAVKAGIIKSGCPVVVSGENAGTGRNGVLETICNYAADLQSPVVVTRPEAVFGYEGKPGRQRFCYETAAGSLYEKLEISLNGTFQVNNCINALEVIEILRKTGYNIPIQSVYEGVKQTGWSGRLQRISEKPELYIDGAHNPDAVSMLYRFITQYYRNSRLIFIVGVLADKDYRGMLNQLMPLADSVITTEPCSPRKMTAEALAEIIRPMHGHVTAAVSCEEAVQLALQQAEGTDGQKAGVIFAFGSLYYLGDLVKAWEKQVR